MKIIPKIDEPSTTDRLNASTGPLTTSERRALLGRLDEIDAEEEKALVEPLRETKRLEAELFKHQAELAEAKRDWADAKQDLAAARRRVFEVPNETTFH